MQRVSFPYNRPKNNFAWMGDCRLIGDQVFTARPPAADADRQRNAALKEQLRRDAVDPAKAEQRSKKIAAKQAKRMRGVVVEVKRKRL